jgi:hypothetical protein
MIEDGAVVAAGLVAERASNPTFADAGWADDEQILVPCDPLAGMLLSKSDTAVRPRPATPS